MSATAARLLVPGVLFLVATISGLVLSRRGRPLNTAIMAGHKIVALVTVVLLSIAVYRLARQASIGAIELGAIAIAVISGLLLFTSGVWLSFGRPEYRAPLLIHKVTLLLTPITGIGAIFFLANAGL